MSLTSLLKRSGNPVHAWFEEHFPESKGVTADANRKLRRNATACPVPLIDGAEASLVGTAVDYLLRACLNAESMEQTVASEATQRRKLTSDPGLKAKAVEAERACVADIRRLEPDRRNLRDDEWSELCVRCLVLARFEQGVRAAPPKPKPGHRPGQQPDPLVASLRACTDLDDLASGILNRATVQDLEILGRAGLEDQEWLRSAKPLVLNPEFSLSEALGGADADFIARDCLVDWKSTAKRTIVKKRELWQLLGYALADTHDEYGIREVGIRALRWRSSVTWRLDDLVAGLAPAHLPRAGIDLSFLREDFARMTEDFRRRQDAWLERMREEVARQLPQRPTKPARD